MAEILGTMSFRPYEGRDIVFVNPPPKIVQPASKGIRALEYA
jgi:hypothetical protein